MIEAGPTNEQSQDGDEEGEKKGLYESKAPKKRHHGSSLTYTPKKQQQQSSLNKRR